MTPSEETRFRWTPGERDKLKQIHALVYGGQAEDVDIDTIGDNKTRCRMLVELIAILETRC
jgi:hypothetical protein